MGGKYTEAQKAATIKYLKEKTEDIRIRVPTGKKGEWQSAAKLQGKSLQRFVVDVVEKELKRIGTNEKTGL